MDSFSGMDGIKIPNKDKYVHFAFYFVFTIFWYLFFRNIKFSRGSTTRLAVFIFAVAYGAAIEVFQGVFTDGRSADICDVVANTSGSAAAVLVLWLIRKKKN